jgi:hypothetical protein
VADVLRARTVPHRLLLAGREITLLLGFLLAYSLIRLTAEDDRVVADRHAAGVLGLERALDIDIESAVNATLGRLPALEVAASYWYAALHYTVTPLALVLLYRLRPWQYRRTRTALLLPTAVALIGYVSFPTTPPRLLGGYTDTLLATADVGWWSGEGSAVQGAASAVNQLAAMPSMHVGWALWCSLVFWQLARTPVQRALAASYAPLTALVVVSTANHWVLDVVVGALLVAGAWLILDPARQRRSLLLGEARPGAEPGALLDPRPPADQRDVALSPDRGAVADVDAVVQHRPRHCRA